MRPPWIRTPRWPSTSHTRLISPSRIAGVWISWWTSRGRRFWIEDMRLSTAGILFFILITPTARAATTPAPDGVDLLRQAVAQEDHVAFSGREEILLWAGEHSVASIVKEDHDG